MAKEKTKPKTEKDSREYIIPLREKCRPVPRYKKTPKAVKTIKQFLVRHMKIYDRDLKKIKLDKYLNEFLWFRGIKNPPHKVNVKVTKENNLIRVELAELPKKLEFKKIRAEKQEKQAQEKVKKITKKPEEKPEQSEEKKEEEKEKKSAVVEETQKLEKQQAKQKKHQAKAPKQPKTQQRKMLAR